MPALKGQDIQRSVGRHQPLTGGPGWVTVQCPYRENGCHWSTSRPDKPGYARSAQLKHSYECQHRPAPATTPRASVYDLPAYAAARGRRPRAGNTL